MFEAGEAYEAMMGRWSRQLAPLFIGFVGVRDDDKVLDVGCGTGSLTTTLAKVTGASKIVGIDPSNGFIEYARSQNADPRVAFEVGDAQELPFPNASFDRCLALLAVDYISDARKAALEMRRVTKKAGIVATAMWDRSRANELENCFWDAALAIDPNEEVFRETGIVRFCRSAFRALGRCRLDRSRNCRGDGALSGFLL